jgi:methyl-accepting chemotaxis protein
MILKAVKMFFRKQHPLKNQVLLGIMLPMAIVMIVIGILVGRFMLVSTEEDVTTTLQSISQQSTNNVNILFKYASNYVNQLSYNEDVINYLNAVEKREMIKTHPLYPSVHNSLVSIGESDENVFLAWVANENANFYLNHSNEVPDESYDLKNRPWYKEAMSREGITYTKPYVEWSTEKTVVSAVKTLTLKDTSHGFVVVDFHLDRLKEIVDDLPLKEKGEVFFINQDQTLVYSKSVGFINSEEITLDSKVKTWLKEQGHEYSTFDTIEWQGEVYYITHEVLKISNWQMIILISRNEILAPVRMFMIYLSLILFFAYIILLVLLSKVITIKLRPIQALKDYGENVALGHLDAIPPKEYINREDEMGILTEAYVKIAEVFKEKNQSLEALSNQQYEAIQQQYNYILEKEKIASLSTLVSGVAHEINNPLGVSITTASFVEEQVNKCLLALRSKTLSKKDFDKYIENFLESTNMLNENLNKAANLIKQFKLISNQQNLQMIDTIDLFETFEQVMKSLKPLYQNRPIHIYNHLNKEVIMKTYKGPLIQVFGHLISNSLNHAFDEGQAGEIQIFSILEGDLLRIYFEDNGKGIQREIMPHIFEAFYTTDQKGDNSGLGLYIVHNLVNQTLSGTIKSEAKESGGVRFVLTLPLNIKN